MGFPWHWYRHMNLRRCLDTIVEDLDQSGATVKRISSISHAPLTETEVVCVLRERRRGFGRAGTSIAQTTAPSPSQVLDVAPHRRAPIAR